MTDWTNGVITTEQTYVTEFVNFISVDESIITLDGDKVYAHQDGKFLINWTIFSKFTNDPYPFFLKILVQNFLMIFIWSRLTKYRYSYI